MGLQTLFLILPFTLYQLHLSEMCWNALVNANESAPLADINSLLLPSEQISAVRAVVPNKSNNEIVLVLQHFENSVDKAVQAFLEGVTTSVTHFGRRTRAFKAFSINNRIPSNWKCCMLSETRIAPEPPGLEPRRCLKAAVGLNDHVLRSVTSVLNPIHVCVKYSDSKTLSLVLVTLNGGNSSVRHSHTLSFTRLIMERAGCPPYVTRLCSSVERRWKKRRRGRWRPRRGLRTLLRNVGQRCLFLPLLRERGGDPEGVERHRQKEGEGPTVPPVSGWSLVMHLSTSAFISALISSDYLTVPLHSAEVLRFFGGKIFCCCFNTWLHEYKNN